MKKVMVHYFSGTGNTAGAVKIIKDRLEKNGYSVHLQPIQKGVLPPVEKYDYHIFAFSTLGFSAPVMMKRYIRKLMNGKKVLSSAIAVFAGHPFQAVNQVERMLRRRNYDVFLTAGIIYPNNWIQFSNLPDKTEASEICASGDKAVGEYITKFISQERAYFRCGPFTAFWSLIAAVSFGLIGRRIFGKAFVADENCDACGICVKSCPAGVLSFQGFHNKKPRWSFNCENCNRCINLCPRKAIQVSTLRLSLHMVLNIALTTLDVVVLSRLYPLLAGQMILPLALAAEIAAVVVLTAFLFWLQFYLLDYLFFILEQLPITRKFFEKSYAKNFNRYTAPGYKPLAKIE